MGSIFSFRLEGLQCSLGAAECTKHYCDNDKKFLKATPLVSAGSGLCCVGCRR